MQVSNSHNLASERSGREVSTAVSLPGLRGRRAGLGRREVDRDLRGVVLGIRMQSKRPRELEARGDVEGVQDEDAGGERDEDREDGGTARHYGKDLGPVQRWKRDTSVVYRLCEHTVYIKIRFGLTVNKYVFRS